jgi:triosephosphate isomerase (TIM)
VVLVTGTIDMRRKLIAGNWKMNTDINSAVQLVNAIKQELSEKEYKTEVLVCPPFTNLQSVAGVIDKTNIKLGAQNCEHRPAGAYTGEISVQMLKSVGCEYVIIGHSERRTYYEETDENVNLKAQAAIEGGLTPIICIGETLDERNEAVTFKILAQQITKAFDGMTETNIANMVLAYEPVWAIGTGVSATTEQADEAHKWIRNYIRGKYGSEASEIRILYGGSMNDKNSAELLSLPDIDGGLIGGASLKADSFLTIINAAEASN